MLTEKTEMMNFCKFTTKKKKTPWTTLSWLFRPFVFYTILTFSSIATSFPVPAAEEHPQTTIFHCWGWIGRWWVVCGFLHTESLEFTPKKFRFDVIRPKNLITVWESFMCRLSNSMPSFMCLGLRKGVCQITLPRLMESCSDLLLSPTASLELSHRDLWELLYRSHQDSSPWTLW